ncbi:MAG: hypothetical protein ABEK50_00770 [bacterium]
MTVGDLTPPERHFSVFLKDITSNIDWTDIDDVIDAFERRIKTWYFDPAQVLIEDMPGNEFIITNIGCILIDTLSQFRAGDENHDAKVFKAFTEKHFDNFDEKLPKVIPSDLVVASSHDVDTVSEAFYSGFRCGLAHSGTILAFGGHSLETDGKLHEVWFDPDNPLAHCYDNSTDEKYPFVIINPIQLINEIQSALDNYIKQLKGARDTSDIRKNFARKLEYDFGEYGTRLRQSLSE